MAAAALPPGPPLAVANPVVTASPSACHAYVVSGSYIAAAQVEAQAGAVAEMIDTCPSMHVTQVQQRCEPYNPEPGALGQQRCVAQGDCQLCGEHLSRFRETNPGLD